MACCNCCCEEGEECCKAPGPDGICCAPERCCGTEEAPLCCSEYDPTEVCCGEVCCQESVECCEGVCCEEGEYCCSGACEEEPCCSGECEDSEDCAPGCVCVDGECVAGCETDAGCPEHQCCVDGECQDAVIGSCLNVTGTILFTCDFSPSLSSGSCEQNVRECDCPEECTESPAGCFGECPFDTPREECENNPECEWFNGDPTVLIEFRPSNDCPCGDFTFCSGDQVCCDNICQEGPCDP